MSKKFAVVMIILSVSSANAAQSAADLFCEKPVEAVCGKNNVDAEERAERLEKTLQAVERLALRQVKKLIPELKNQELTKDSLLALSDRKLRDRAMTVYYRTSLEAVRKHIGNAPAAGQLHFSRIKERLERVIKTHVAVDKTEAIDMLQNLKETKIVDAVQILSGDVGDQALRDEVIESCGRDGLEENAFQDQVDGNSYLIVCPGDYLGGMERKERALPPSELLLANEVWTLGHETGHVIDSGNHPETYKNMKACLAENHAHELKNGIDDYMSEITADHWGNEELASYLLRFSNREDRFAVVRRSLISICTSEDDGVHPSGKFRIEMMRRNPRIHKAMGCKGSEAASPRGSEATCTLRGKNKTVFLPTGESALAKKAARVNKSFK